MKNSKTSRKYGRIHLAGMFNFSTMIYQPLTRIKVANFESKKLTLFMLQTLTNALLKTSVTRMPHVATPKDLTAALAKMDLEATAKTARVRFCLRA